MRSATVVAAACSQMVSQFQLQQQLWSRADHAALPGNMCRIKLRDEAKKQLEAKFDLKAFHDEILNGGAMPLDLLQERVEAWIKAQAAKA